MLGRRGGCRHRGRRCSLLVAPSLECQSDDKVTFTPKTCVKMKRTSIPHEFESSPLKDQSTINMHNKMEGQAAQQDRWLHELKAHFDLRTDETKNEFKSYMRGVESKVEKNSVNIREIQDAIKRIKRSSTSSATLTSETTETEAIRDHQEDADLRRQNFMLARRSLRI